jgi:hypothetical protein
MAERFRPPFVRRTPRQSPPVEPTPVRLPAARVKRWSRRVKGGQLDRPLPLPDGAVVDVVLR